METLRITERYVGLLFRKRLDDLHGTGQRFSRELEGSGIANHPYFHFLTRRGVIQCLIVIRRCQDGLATEGNDDVARLKPNFSIVSGGQGRGSSRANHLHGNPGGIGRRLDGEVAKIAGSIVHLLESKLSAWESIGQFGLFDDAAPTVEGDQQSIFSVLGKGTYRNQLVRSGERILGQHRVILL